MTHTRYDTIEKTTTYSSSAKNTNYNAVDATRVRASGDGLTRAYKNEKATFSVDTREGGTFIFLLNQMISSISVIFLLHRKWYVDGRRFWS